MRTKSCCVPGRNHGKKTIQTWSFTLTLFPSVHLTTLGRCNLTVTKVQHSSWPQVSGMQTASELLREPVCLPACPENVSGLTQTRLVKSSIMCFNFYYRLVYIRSCSSLFVKILPKMERHSLIFLFSHHHCCFQLLFILIVVLKIWSWLQTLLSLHEIPYCYA